MDELFDNETYYRSFFKTPLKVNNCSESMLGPTSRNIDDYAALLVLKQLMTFEFLFPLIREKGGAYGAGCNVNDSGLITMFSYRDPNIDKTYENFKKAIDEVASGKFTDA